MIIDTDKIPPDMSGSTIKALCHIYERGECRPTDLSREVGFTRPSATGLVDRAEAQGLVMRGRIPGDRRCQAIQLTRRGRSLVEGLRPSDAALAGAAVKYSTLEVAR